MMYGFTAWTARIVKLGRLSKGWSLLRAAPLPKERHLRKQMSFFWEESREIDILKRDL